MSDDPRLVPYIDPAQATHSKFYPRGPFISIILSQGILESDWFTRPAGINNFFGIKATRAQIASGAATKVWTREFYNGRYVPEDLYFANYPSLEAGFDAHATLLTEPWYQLCIDAKDAFEYARALQACHYATAPDYAEILISIITFNDLTRYDN